jgi:hypothetical protein
VEYLVYNVKFIRVYFEDKNIIKTTQKHK